MTDLSLIPKPSLPVVTLPDNFQKNTFLVALQAKKVMDCARDREIMEVVIPAIENAIFDLGLKMSGPDVDLLQDKVLFEIKSLFKTLTLDELKAAIYNGARGMYESEPQYGLSVVRVTKWFAGYLSAYERKQAKDQLQKMNYGTYEPTEKEKQALRLENLLRLWHEFQQNGTVEDAGNAVYSTLDKLRLITFNSERKKGFMDQAKAKLYAFYDPIKVVGNIGKQNDYRALIKNMEAGNEKERLVVEAKKIALNTFFKELQEIGTDLKGLINL